jgi:hypothetical protein
MLAVLGWLLLAVSAYYGLKSHSIDRELQSFRAADVPESAYRFIPLRARRRFYTPDGAPLVDAFWRAIRRMYGFAVVAAILLHLSFS